MQTTDLQNILRPYIGFRLDGDTAPDINLPDSLKQSTSGTYVDDLSEILTLATLKRTMRLGLTDFPDFLTQTRDAAIRAVVDALTIKLAEAGLANQLLFPAPAFRTQDINLRPQYKLPGRRVGIRIEPKLADVVVTVERIQLAMDYAGVPFDLTLQLQEEGETDVLQTIVLHQTQHYQWRTITLPTLNRNTAYWLTYNEDDLGAHVVYNTLTGVVRPGNCQGCRANCPGSYANIQPIYIDSFYRAQPVQDTNYGLNLTVSAQADLSGRLLANPVRLLSVYKLQLAITFLEKVAFSRRHNADTEEAIQAALFLLTDKDNAERLPPKLEKAWSVLIGALGKEVSPGLVEDAYGSIDFETT